jgi:AcrR family transcriptional regulator
MRTGFHDLTIAGVAAEVGISRQALYGHFASKAEMVVAASEHLFEEVRRRYGLPPLPDDADAVEALDHAVEDYARTVPHVAGVALANYAARAGDEAAEAAWAHRTRSRRGAYLRIAERLQREGRLRAGWTPAEAADALFGLLSVRMYEVLVIEAGWPLARYRDRLRALARGALLAEATEETEATEDAAPGRRGTSGGSAVGEARGGRGARVDREVSGGEEAA